MRSTVLDESKNLSSAAEEQQIERHVQQVAQSAAFLRAETLRKLLLYLWDHRNEELSEYAVATEALGRRSGFDPKTDASVRVQISRLRRKLKDFYESEGSREAYQLQIPMGSHMIVALEVDAFPALLPLPSESIEQAAEISAPVLNRRSVFLPIFAMLTVLLAAGNAVLLREHFTRERAQPSSRSVSGLPFSRAEHRSRSFCLLRCSLPFPISPRFTSARLRSTPTIRGDNRLSSAACFPREGHPRWTAPTR